MRPGGGSMPAAARGPLAAGDPGTSPSAVPTPRVSTEKGSPFGFHAPMSFWISSTSKRDPLCSALNKAVAIKHLN